MTSIPTVSDGSQPRQWSIINRTLIISADSKQVLAVMNGGSPLLLPPGSVLQFGDPLGQALATAAARGKRHAGHLPAATVASPHRAVAAPGVPAVSAPGPLRSRLSRAASAVAMVNALAADI